MNPRKDLPIIRIKGNTAESINDQVIREHPLTIMLDKQELVTLLCTPADLKELAIGFLFAEGIISTADDIAGISIGYNDTFAMAALHTPFELSPAFFQKRLISAGCGKGMSFYDRSDLEDCRPIESDITVQPDAMHALMQRFQERSILFRETGGVHAAALAANTTIKLFFEDIGRHNAVDKIAGALLLKNQSPANTILLSSGRISSEIVIKAIRMQIPVIVSRAAPTALAVELADKMNITLLGFVRGSRMNIYTHPQRVALPEAEE